MSATTRSSRAGWPGLGAFCVGIAFIVAATVLNVAHDRLSGFKLDTLPLYIGTLYAVSGKLGVTILLVTLGMIFLLASACFRPHRPLSLSSASGGMATVADSQPFFCTGHQPSSSGASGATTHSSGRVVLETWKYLTPPNGTTNNTP